MAETATRSAVSSTARGIAIAALLIALGNIASRILGLGRMSTIAYFFGSSPSVDAFVAAWTIPSTLYDLLINGAISAALIPVFSEFAEGDEREFWCIVSGIVNIVLLVLAAMVLVLIWQSPLVVNWLVQSPELRPQTGELVRMLLPAVIFMGLSGLMTAVLYARRRFLLPAFASSVFNLGIIAGAAFLHAPLHIASLAVGVLIGAAGQVLLQVPGIWGMHYSLTFNLKHPAVQRILRLYAPVALGIGFSIIGTLLDRWLASGFPDALSIMQFATTLIQFPLGLVAAAVSLAVLPTLSRQDANADMSAFRQTLAMGIKVVLLLVLPATAGLAALTIPIIKVLFERGAFTAEDTAVTAVALLLYLPSLPAAAIDQLLIFAFYARKNTLTPNLVQGVAIGIYLLTALLLLFFFQSRLGFLALVIGNSAQWIGHAALMLWLLMKRVSLRGLRIGETVFKVLLASTLMSLAVYGVANVALPTMFPRALLLNSPFIHVLIAGGIGGLLYLSLCSVLRVEALDFFSSALGRKLKGGRG